VIKIRSYCEALDYYAKKYPMVHSTIQKLRCCRCGKMLGWIEIAAYMEHRHTFCNKCGQIEPNVKFWDNIKKKYEKEANVSDNSTEKDEKK